MLGSGTLLNPYIIQDIDDLQAMQNDLDAYYELGNDIDASETETWNEDPGNPGTYFGFEPVGDWQYPFTGSLDGKDYKISGLYFNRPGIYRGGLFGRMSEPSYVKRVHLIDVNILCGQRLGGIVGELLPETSVQDCYVSGDLHSPLYSGYAGGLVGYASEGAEILRCFSNVSVTGHSILGGLVGENGGAEIRQSGSQGTVDGSTISPYYGFIIGGLVGDNRSPGKIIECYSVANVIGGIGHSTLGNCIGGLAGRHWTLWLEDEPAVIQDSYAMGSVDVTAAQYPPRAGGLVGQFRGDAFEGALAEAYIINSYSVGLIIIGTQADDVGGLVGRRLPVNPDLGIVTNSFWDTATSGRTTSAGGEGKTTAEMKRYATFKNAGWDIGRTYRANPNDGYPFLSWQVGRSPVWLLTGGGGGWIPGPGPKPAPPVGLTVGKGGDINVARML